MQRLKNICLNLIFLVKIFSDASKLNPVLVESCNAKDKEALLDLKHRVEYSDRARISTWDSYTDCCTACKLVERDATNGRVVRINPFLQPDDPNFDLSVFGEGTISPFLGNLTYLQVLDLTGFSEPSNTDPNYIFGLSGPIPSELGKLSHLTHLYLT